MLLVYFIPFIYLFTTYLRVLRADDHVGAGRRGWSTLVGTSGFLITLFAMVVACVPPSGTADPLLFELKVLGGAAAFVVVGGVVYWRGKRGH